jgi:AcrR family transcriptional regulator
MSTKQAAAAQTRERLLNAAIEAMRTQGINALTLDAVAKGADVSKGGLLHHFKSKDALIEAILRYLFEHFDTRVRELYEQESDRPGRWLRAYVRATFEDDPLPLELIMLLASAIDNRAMLSLIREDFQAWHERLINDGVPKARATIIRQATDAYWQERLIDLEPKTAEDRQAIMDELLRLTEV